MKLQNSKKTTVGIIVTVILVLSAGAYWFSMRGHDHGSHAVAAGQVNGEKKPLYHCPMHPQVTSHEPGICPICHMDLQLIDEGGTGDHSGHEHGSADGSVGEQAAAPTRKQERKLLHYQHPMRPDITSDKPAKDEMGMDYIPVYSDEVESNQNSGPSQIAGRAGFNLTPERQQIIGVTTTTVEKRSLSAAIRATGRVAFDPELFTAIEEYRQALSASQGMGESSYSALRDQSRALVQSSKTKLKLMGLTDQQIRKIRSGSSDPMNLLLPEGKAWVYAEIFEYEVAGVKPGQSIEATAPSIPGEVFKGKVSSISPILNAPTRTVRVRAEVPDPKGLLRPDTFLNVKILNKLGETLSIPEDSVLFTGDQAYAFVVKGEGRFEPVPVSLGQKTDKYYEVIDGLQEGQKVVTGANFLIDSESRLRSVVAPQAAKKANSGSNNQNTEQEKAQK